MRLGSSSVTSDLDEHGLASTGDQEPPRRSKIAQGPPQPPHRNAAITAAPPEPPPRKHNSTAAATPPEPPPRKGASAVAAIPPSPPPRKGSSAAAAIPPEPPPRKGASIVAVNPPDPPPRRTLASAGVIAPSRAAAPSELRGVIATDADAAPAEAAVVKQAGMTRSNTCDKLAVLEAEAAKAEAATAVQAVARGRHSRNVSLRGTVESRPAEPGATTVPDAEFLATKSQHGSALDVSGLPSFALLGCCVSRRKGKRTSDVVLAQQLWLAKEISFSR
mmetsp:Transcript_40525/g.91898  ORF Transcript_40525/g.91898 Transcript_40525/m.91898 type:complete len:276 (-) Transcript_40525:261-1088(-)